MIPEYFVFLAALINFCSMLTYIIATLRGETRPNRITWFMWGFLGLVITAAQLSGGVGWSTFVVFTAGLGPTLVFFCSFANKKAYWKTSPFDYVCGVMSVCGLIGWYLTRNQDIAIGFSVFADFLAALPTLRKTYNHPESENGPTYLMGLLSSIVGVLCVQQRTFTAYAFISYLTFIGVVLSFLVYRKKIEKFLGLPA